MSNGPVMLNVLLEEPSAFSWKICELLRKATSIFPSFRAANKESLPKNPIEEASTEPSRSSRRPPTFCSTIHTRLSDCSARDVSTGTLPAMEKMFVPGL